MKPLQSWIICSALLVIIKDIQCLSMRGNDKRKCTKLQDMEDAIVRLKLHTE